MKQIIQNYKTGKLSVEEVPQPVIQPGGVLVNNSFSLISAGTECTSIELAKKSLLGKARSRPEDLKKVLSLAKKQGFLNAYKTAMGRLEQPLALGYSCSGTVIEIGENVDNIKVGDRVACAGAGYASHAEVIFVPKNLCAKVPGDVSLEWAAFSTLGAIALQGIRQAGIDIGQNVAVIGLGLLGQLTVQILKASGCRVLGIDIEHDKLKLARVSGADFAVHRSKDIAKVVEKMTNGIGVDAVIITAATSSNDPFLLAPQICRDRARIVLVGVAKLDFPREPYYRKELSLVLARSYGPGRYDATYEEKGVDYPAGYVRWTEKRNMEAVLGLMKERKLNIDPLITHRFKITDAQKAYKLILEKTEQKQRPLGVLFEYGTAREQKKIFIVTSKPHNFETSIRIGFIGPGNFARSFLLPNIRNYKNVGFVGIADVQGPLAKAAAKKFGFKYCTSDYKELINDQKISTIFIATRHNLHAPLIIEALKAGKHVYCEKPLCLNADELDKIVKTFNAITKLPNDSITPVLMVGYNRRFAPLVAEAKTFLGQKIGPYMINCRINAGKLPPEHWILDPQQGGGRIIGEVCHFVDLAGFFCKSRIAGVHAETMSGLKDIHNDNIAATLKYEDGSLAIISYFAVGDKDFPKERIEIFGDEKAVVIDDFTETVFSFNGEKKKMKRPQDKGYKNEVNAFLNAVAGTGKSPIPFAEIVEATAVTFAINESLKTGKTVALGQVMTKE